MRYVNRCNFTLIVITTLVWPRSCFSYLWTCWRSLRFVWSFFSCCCCAGDVIKIDPAINLDLETLWWVFDANDGNCFCRCLECKTKLSIAKSISFVFLSLGGKMFSLPVGVWKKQMWKNQPNYEYRWSSVFAILVFMVSPIQGLKNIKVKQLFFNQNSGLY